MPYASDKQRRWAHTESAKEAGFPTKKFDMEAHKAKKKVKRQTMLSQMKGK